MMPPAALRGPKKLLVGLCRWRGEISETHNTALFVQNSAVFFIAVFR